MSDLDQRLERLLDVPWELVEYERWASAQSSDAGDYLFAEAKARFELENSDVIQALPELAARDAKAGSELRSPLRGHGVVVPGVPRAVALRLLAAIDGQRTLAELRLIAGADRPALERLLRAGTGTVLFAPAAVAALEACVSGVELVRFVGAPYEIVRNYWANSGAVRAAAESALDALREPETAIRALRKLHALLLLGPELRSFYRPASKIAARGVNPGALYTARSERLSTPSGTLLLSGPRVGVGLIGGAAYQRLIAARAGDPEAVAAARRLTDEDGLGWGEVVIGRALDDPADAAWFCPPRPIERAHFEKLFGAFAAALDAARAGDSARAVDELARFHSRFVRLHPFRAANQSLSMLLANRVLERALGSGIPHLVLDQLALRLNEPAYARVFRLAVAGHQLGGTPKERWLGLAERKARAYELIQRLQRAERESELERAVTEDAAAARLALSPA